MKSMTTEEMEKVKAGGCAKGWAKVIVGILILSPDLYESGGDEVLESC